MKKTTIQKKEKPPIKTPFSEKCMAPVDEEVFLFYSDIGIMAGQMEMIVKSPEIYKFWLTDNKTGQIETYKFADNPINRMFVAFKENMTEKEQNTIMPAIGTRMLALIQMLQQKKLQKWTKKDPDSKTHIRVPEAVLRAAAVANVNDKLLFDMEEFSEIVERKLKEEEEKEKSDNNGRNKK